MTSIFRTILATVLAGAFLLSIPMSAAQANDDKAAEKGKKGKGDKKDEKADKGGGGGW